MIKKTILILILPILGFAQTNKELRKLLNMHGSACEEVSVSSQTAITKLNYTDVKNIENIIEQWSKACGYNEATFRVHVLLAIQQGTLKEEEMGENVEYFRQNYQNRISESKSGDADLYYENDKEYYLFIPFNKAFDTWTKEWATQLLKKDSLSALDELYLSFYTTKKRYFFEDNLREEKYSEIGFIKKERTEYEESRYNDPKFTFLLGSWNANGSLSRYMGTSASLGFSLYSSPYNSWRYGGELMFHIPNTIQNFRINTEDTTEHTKATFLFNLNVGANRTLIKGKKMELKALGGIGLEILSTDVERIPGEDSEEEPSTYSITTYHFNVGLDLGIKTRNLTSWGIRATYNLVDYNVGLRAASDLSGGYTSLLLYYQL